MENGRLFLTGDKHGNATGEMRNLSSGRFLIGPKLTEKDIVVILGDFGFLWNIVMTKEEAYWLKWLSEKPWTTLFVDGNHENFDILDGLPTEEKFGGTVGVVDSRVSPLLSKMKKPVYHLKRGHIFNLNGKRSFVMGGAASVDKSDRTPHETWWPQELHDSFETKRALSNLEKAGNSVDLILTHTCPSSVISEFFPYEYSRKKDSVSDFLEEIKNSTEFDAWYFGHFHENESHGKFHCLYGGIAEVK